jgi:hypothetical protein
MSRLVATLLLSTLAVLAAGCDQLGIEPASAIAARREADGKAIGGACRHAGRAIEDCYTLNRKADRAAVYAGWREMNEYMLEHKIEPVAPVLSSDPIAAPKPTEHADAADAPDKPAEKPAAAKVRKQAS